jgi:uncharacterized coiled-coil protein SlyX
MEEFRQPNFTQAAGGLRLVADQLELCSNLPAVDGGARIGEVMDAVLASLAQLNQRMTNLEGNLNQRMTTLESNLNQRMTTLESNLNQKVDDLAGKVDGLSGKVDTLDQKIIVMWV